jgi:hypothetical protein
LFCDNYYYSLKGWSASRRFFVATKENLKVERDVGQDDPPGVDDERRDLVAHGLKGG